LDGEDVRSDDEGDEEEVFALKGMPDDSDDEDVDEEGTEEEKDDADMQTDPGPSTVRQKKGKKSARAAGSSDEESASEEEEEGWGRSKAAYYSSNAGQLESDDEEANEMEEQEARRLQTKARDTMADDDFGLDDIVESAPIIEEYAVHIFLPTIYANSSPSDLVEPAAPVVTKLPEDRASLLRYLQKTNPEALSLAGDWDDAVRTLIKTQAKIALYVTWLCVLCSF
jgi:U3 small nucleolar RNA-associated protein 3